MLREARTCRSTTARVQSESSPAKRLKISNVPRCPNPGARTIHPLGRRKASGRVEQSGSQCEGTRRSTTTKGATTTTLVKAMRAQRGTRERHVAIHESRRGCPQHRRGGSPPAVAPRVTRNQGLKAGRGNFGGPGPPNCKVRGIPKNNQHWASLPPKGTGNVRSDDVKKLKKKHKQNHDGAKPKGARSGRGAAGEPALAPAIRGTARGQPKTKKSGLAAIRQSGW